MRGVNSMSNVFKFQNLTELLQRGSLIHKWMKIWFPIELSKSHGYVTQLFNNWTSYINTNIGQVFAYSRRYLEGRADDAEAARRAALLKSHSHAHATVVKDAGTKSGHGTDDDASSAPGDELDQGDDNDKDNNALLERLNRLGISSVTTELVEGDDAKAIPAIQRLGEKMVENDIQGLQTWERLWHCCLGIHNIEFISGRNKLGIACQGLDIMEFFPIPPNITEVKQTCDDRKNAANKSYAREKKLNHAGIHTPPVA